MLYLIHLSVSHLDRNKATLRYKKYQFNHATCLCVSSDTLSVVFTCYICFRELFWVRNNDDRSLIVVVKVISNWKQLASTYNDFKYLKVSFIHIFFNRSLSLIHFLKWDVCYNETIIPCLTHYGVWTWKYDWFCRMKRRY